MDGRVGLQLTAFFYFPVAFVKTYRRFVVALSSSCLRVASRAYRCCAPIFSHLERPGQRGLHHPLRSLAMGRRPSDVDPRTLRARGVTPVVLPPRSSLAPPDAHRLRAHLPRRLVHADSSQLNCHPDRRTRDWRSGHRRDVDHHAAVLRGRVCDGSQGIDPLPRADEHRPRSRFWLLGRMGNA